MKISRFIFYPLIFVFFIGDANADAVKSQVASFTEMMQEVGKVGNPQATIVVLDNDDTLTMMSCPDQHNVKTCQYLGGPAWFSWQQNNIKNQTEPRVANNFNELLTISGLLFAMNKMVYTGDDVPIVLSSLAGKGIRVLTETARGISNMSATEQQFSMLPVNNETLLSFMANHALILGDLTSKAGPYIPCTQGSFKPITYQQGIMYLSGQDKGVILKCMLDEYNAQQNAQPIKHVVFLDDTLANVDAVFNAFYGQDKYTVIALHYTKLQAHKAALTEGKMAKRYQREAMKQWKSIRRTMKNSLRDPVLP